VALAAQRAGAQPCTPPPGIVSWWPGDGNAIDIVDGNSGTLINGATFAPGQVGQAFSFDGVNDYVEMPDSSTLDISTGHTVDLWVKVDAYPPSGQPSFLVNKWVSGAEDKALAIDPTGKVIYYLFNSFGGIPLYSAADLTLGTWYHIAATYDGTIAKVYINGVFDASKAAGGDVNDSSGKLYFGDNPERPSGFPFKGQIDEVEWYNRALTPQEILALYDAGSTGMCEGDCDGDGIFDEDEADAAQKDCDRDGICNGMEIANCAPGDLSCADCNTNSIPDRCEPDCNDNDIVDSCDIANCPPGDLACADCTGNGVPDGCEADCNSNDIADSCDIANCTPGDLTCADCNTNGYPDGCESGGCCLDTDDDGTYEACSQTSEQLCAQADGIWRGPCRPCPTQNVAIFPEPGGTVFVHWIGAPIDCLAETAQRGGDCSPGGPFFDAWKSDANAGMCHNFGAAGHAIPADFFDPGSDVFTGSLCLKGVPLGAPGFGEADTLIQRSADPFDRCAFLPPANPVSVQIDISALSLVSTAPISVTYNGQPNPTELWNVSVDLSTVSPPSGTLTATKTHCNGGTYTSVLYVQPRFTFTKDSDPGQVRVLDTGLSDIPPVILDQQTPAPWVHDVDPNLGLTGDHCSTFHAGIEDQVPETSCDCNTNSRRDRCDIEDGTSADANGNDIPDECDSRMPTPGDDTCQTAGANTGIPCATDADCTVTGSACGNKSRYISITPANVAGGTSIQIEVASMPQFPSMVGDIYYAGPEQSISNAPNPALRGAPVQCTLTPNAQTWTTGVLHLFGPIIVPGSTYNVRMCDASGANCSVPLLVATGKWGDVIRGFGGGSQPNFGDVNAIVQKFSGLASAPSMPRADLVGPQPPGTQNTPNQTANFSDVSADVSAFSGFAYPYTVQACP